jgi:hypothetical protein
VAGCALTATLAIATSAAAAAGTTSSSVPVGATGSLPAVWSEVDNPYVIDPSTANALVYSYWSLRQTDLVDGSSQALSLVEEGPALTEDVHSCGCGVVPWGPALAESAWVTKQTAFPAYFLAEGVARIPSTSSEGALVLLIFPIGLGPRRLLEGGHRQNFLALFPGLHDRPSLCFRGRSLGRAHQGLPA